MTYRLPYGQAGTNLHGEPIIRPVAPVQLELGPTTFRTTALLDTGSPITVFARGTGEALLVRFGHAGAVYGYTQLLGKSVKVQFEYVYLSLFDEQDEETSAWEARVGFIMDPTFTMQFQGILGDDGFFSRWAVTFNKCYDYFVIQHPDDATDS